MMKKKIVKPTENGASFIIIIAAGGDKEFDNVI